MTPGTFGTTLGRWRRRAGLSQAQLAERAGLSTNAVSVLERGARRNPFPRTVQALTAALTLAPAEAQILAGLARTGGPAARQPAAKLLPIPRQLPAPHSGFTGRTAEIATLDAVLPPKDSPPATVVCAITGTPGVGKTALAIAWAHRVRHRFPDAHLYADLRGYGPAAPADPAEVIDGFLRALDVPAEKVPPAAADRAALFRSLVDGARLLIVLDNARDADQVRPLLPGSARALVVVTSRDSLTGLAVTCGATRVTLGLLPTTDAERLLRPLVGAARADAEPGAVSQLADLCARLPLALQLGGQRAAAHPHHPLAEIVASLMDERERLASLSRTADGPTAVRAVFSWSYRNLAEPQARLFRLLGAAPGQHIDTLAAATLAAAQPDEVGALLSDLADVHLLDAVEPGRFRMHDLLRLYAADLLDADARAQAVQRLSSYYVHAAAAADRALNPARDRATVDGAPTPTLLPSFVDAHQALSWCDREVVNIVAMVRAAAAAGLHAAAWQLANNMWSYFYLTKRHTEWTSTHQLGLSAAEMSDDLAGRARMLNGLAPTVPLPAASELLTAAYDLFDRIGDKRGAASTLVNLADAHLHARRYTDAVRYCEQALSRLSATSSPYVEAAAVCNLGEAYLALGRHTDAIDTFTRGRELCGRHGNRVGEAVALVHLGEAYAGGRQNGAAVTHLDRGLALCRENGDRRGALRALLALADVHSVVGAAHAARQCWEQALPLLDAAGDGRARDIRRLMSEGPGQPATAKTGAVLTPAEERIAGLVAGGLTNREVASITRLSPKTVEVNLTRVYQKLRIRNRTELANALRAPDAAALR